VGDKVNKRAVAEIYTLADDGGIACADTSRYP
jgi:hypothetical protein